MLQNTARRTDIKMFSVIIAAAGSGTRMGSNENKIFIDIDGTSVIKKTVDKFIDVDCIGEIIVAYNKADKERIQSILNGYDVKYVEGGATRALSVLNALKSVSCPYVLIHDAARPFVSKELIERVIVKTVEYGACIPVIDLIDTVKQVENNEVKRTLDRNKLKFAQTPQGFDAAKLIKAYNASEGGTDDCAVYETFGEKVYCVDGERTNIKLTVKEDLIPNRRVGNGFDTHRLVENRKLILGGVEIPHNKGLLGHSDADVLIHAVMDALLSSAGLRDIGYYFPDTDNVYKDISSVELLKRVKAMLDEKNYKVVNISASILDQKPKLSPYIPQMKENIAQVLDMSADDIGISATTTEGIGLVGREEGISVYAVALIEK